MKVKLLKRLHKRYSWYFNKEKFPVLIDHLNKRVTVFDVEQCCALNGYAAADLDKFVKVPMQEWALRHMKVQILKPYGWSMEVVRYKLAMRRLKQKQS